MCLICKTSNIKQTTYCERGLSAEFWAEPINAFSNLLFPLLAAFSYRFLRKNNINDKDLLALPFLLATVGVGSFLYHTARNSITLILDAAPLYIFILYAIFLTLNELTNKAKSLLILIGFVALEVILSIYVPREFMNGSIRHITAIMFIAVIGVFVIKKFGRKVIKPFIGIVGFYAIAILFRSADSILCEYIVIGTHFLWHISAALAGYSAILTLGTIRIIKRNNNED